MSNKYCPNCHSFQPMEKIVAKGVNIGLKIIVSDKEVRFYNFYECIKCGFLGSYREEIREK